MAEAAGPPKRFEPELAKACIKGSTGAYSALLIGPPVMLLLICTSILTMVTGFYYVEIRQVMFSILGEDAYGFSGMWQVQVTFWFLCLLSLGSFLIGLFLLVMLLAKRGSSVLVLTRLLPTCDRLDRLDHPLTSAKMGRGERMQQLHYSAEASEHEWATFIPVFVLWVGPTVMFAVCLPLIKLVTFLG